MLIDLKEDVLLSMWTKTLFFKHLKTTGSHSSLSVQFFKLAPNEPLSDLLGAAADVVKFGIAPEAASGVLIDVAISTEQLNAFVGHGHSSS